MQVYNRWADRDMTRMELEFQEWEWEDTDDYIHKYRSNIEPRSLRGVLGKYLEGIGVLIERGLIDPTLVDDLMSSAVLMYWQKFGPVARAQFQLGLNQDLAPFLLNPSLVILFEPLTFSL